MKTLTVSRWPNVEINGELFAFLQHHSLGLLTCVLLAVIGAWVLSNFQQGG